MLVGRHGSSSRVFGSASDNQSATDVPRTTVICGPASPQRPRTVTTPAASSSGPTITRAAGSRAVGLLQLGLERAAIVGAHRRQAGPAQLVAQVAGRAPPGHVDDEGVRRRRGRPAKHALGVTGQQQPLDPDAEPDPRGGRAPERLDQAVVAPAAADGVLGRRSSAVAANSKVVRV